MLGRQGQEGYFLHLCQDQSQVERPPSLGNILYALVGWIHLEHSRGGNSQCANGTVVEKRYHNVCKDEGVCRRVDRDRTNSESAIGRSFKIRLVVCECAFLFGKQNSDVYETTCIVTASPIPTLPMCLESQTHKRPQTDSRDACAVVTLP